jgi:type II secretion system protein L
VNPVGRPAAESRSNRRGRRPASLLRVRFDAPPNATASQPWALYDASGLLLRTGNDPPDRWPVAEAAEAVVGASSARVAVVVLPPLPPTRLRAAAAFAVEDQVAGTPATQHLAVAQQAPGGSVRVLVVEHDLVRDVVALPAAIPGLPAWRRVVAEPELAPVDEAWHWCAEDAPDGPAFVRFGDGSAIAIAPPTTGALPVELQRLIERRQPAPESIAVHATVPDTLLAQWAVASGIPFVARPAWRWAESTPAAFAAATDLLQGDFAPVTTARAPARGRLWRPALAIGIAALALHVSATLAEWAWLRIDAAREAQAWRMLATDAGVAVDETTDARAALARRFAELRHANGLAAPGDALPLLARAAPALSRLPRGALKSASYSAGAWTIELASLEPEALRDFDAGMKAAGLPALIARTGGGVRARFGTAGP